MANNEIKLPEGFEIEEPTISFPEGFEVEIEGGRDESYVKQVWGAWMKGGMRLGQAVLEAPARIRYDVLKVKPYPGMTAEAWEDIKKSEVPTATGKIAKMHEKLVADHKRGREFILENHPEWEYDPPEDFLDLLASPRKLSLAIAESTPLLVAAGVTTAAGHPEIAVAMMYTSEGTEAKEQALAYGTTEEESEQAYHLYGSVASILEYLQLKGIVKIGKGAFNKVLGRTVQKIGSKTVTREIVEATAKEALQESSQGAWGEATAKIVYDRPVEGGLVGFIDRRAQEGLIGGTMGLIPGLGGSVAGVVSSKAARSEKVQAVEELKSKIEESEVSEAGKNKLYEDFERIIQDVSEGKFDVADAVVQDRVEAQALPAAQQDAAETVSRSKAEYVARSEELRGLEYDQLVELVNEGDELAAWRIQEMDAEAALEQGLPTFEVLFAQMLEGDEVAKVAIQNGEYKGGRARQQALEAAGRVDPTVPATDEQVQNFAKVKIHSLARTLGVDKKDRGRIQNDIVGKKSLKDMTLQEVKRVEAYFVAEAKKRGLSTSTGKELARVVHDYTTPKKVQELSGTKPTAWRRMLQTPDKIVSWYMQTTRRVERLLEALDGFTEGPIYNSIWTAVHTQLVNSRTKYTDRVGEFKGALIDVYTPELNTEAGMAEATEMIQAEQEAAGEKARKLGKRAVRKLVGDSLRARYLTGGKEIILEATDANPELALTPSERIGMYLAMKNENSREHLLSGNLAEFTNPAAVALEVVQGMSVQEKQIGDWILADLESNFDRANQAAVLGLGRTLDQQDNYFPISIIDTAGLQKQDFLSTLEDKFTKKGFRTEPSEVKARVKGAGQPLDLDAFSVYVNHMKRIEQFIHMAPVAKSVGNILNTREFRQAVNNATSGHGTGILDRWLKNAIQGHAVDPHTGLAAKTLLWSRQKGVLYSLALNVPSVARQFISGFNAVASHPTILAYATEHITKSANPAYYRKLEDRMRELSPEMETRSFERYLASVKHQAQAARLLVGKKEFSEKALGWQKWADRHTVTIAWNAFYEAGVNSEAVQKQFDLDGSDEAAIAYANKMIARTQPMGDVEHLPDFFVGGPIERLLSTFQNQVNNNWNFWVHDIYGMRKAGKISRKMVTYRVLFSNVLPSMMFGAISRGGVPDDWKDAVFDWAAYSISPIFLVGRLVIDAVLGFAGGQTSVEDILPANLSKTVEAVIKKEPGKAALYATKTVGGITGRIPNQAIRTGQGIHDIVTGETDDLRRLIYSDWSLTRYGWPEGKEEAQDWVQR